MRLPTKTVFLTLLAGLAVLLLWLGAWQARLSRDYAQLLGEIAELKEDATDLGRSMEGSRPRPRPDPLGTQLGPRATDAPEVAALQRELKQLGKVVGELRDSIAQLQAQQVQDPTRLSGEFISGKHFSGFADALAIGPAWGAVQVVGEPNTHQLGDISTAWAPKRQDGGEEWLHVDFDAAVPLSEINVHETHNPGAISKVAAIMPDGSEKVIWEGNFDGEEASGIVERAFQVDESITANSVKIYMDTTRISGWNEIDAVEIVGADNSRQWASSARASSSYAD